MSSDTPSAPQGQPAAGGVADAAGGGAPAEPLDPAEELAGELLSLPGVAALHGGLFGEVATYLPGRRVTGIRLDPERTDVHVSIEYGAAVHDVVEAVRSATARRVGGRVDVYVEDVAPPTSA
ncbi:hypothetical protein GCM10009737_04170 [Nocardioides lentus]|uniref:Asp23/Gls24 family envelope stress response protein n=1 Tax=Nocardioides lentus TaxID=338077 RepID=A0ABN2P166_9ACTN